MANAEREELEAAGIAVPIVEEASLAGELLMWLAIVAVNVAHNSRR